MTHVVTDPSSTMPLSRREQLEREVEEAAAALATARAEDRDTCRERLVIVALPLADAIARRYAGRGIETEDLLQVARTALVKAVNRYTPGAGSGFAAYMTPTVAGELKRWFRDHGWSVRPPRRVQELRSRLGAQEEGLRGLHLREPHDGELAGALGVTLRDLDEVRRWTGTYRAASLDAVTPTGTSLVDQLVDESSPTDAVDLHDALNWALTRLSQRQRLILRLRYVDELTQAEIGRRLGVSQMQVSRLLRAIVDQLRRDLDLEAESA